MTDSKIRLGVIGLGRFGFTLAHATELVPEIEIVNLKHLTANSLRVLSLS